MVKYLEIAQNVLKLESEALISAAKRVKKVEIDALIKNFEHLASFGGHLIFCGVGKSGIIGQKLASTFSSLGLPSSFLHPVEALHGDLGRINEEKDVIIFLSKSGTTEEVLKLIPFINISRSRRLALLGEVKSPIAEHCNTVFDCSVDQEACINNQAPTTSSTLALAMGDALAVIYEQWAGLSKEGFAINHPGGVLGKKLRIKVRDLMCPASESAILNKDSLLKEAVLRMTKNPTGACAIVGDKNFLEGILVEGDIRRTFTVVGEGLETNIGTIMNREPVIIGPDALAYDALLLMEDKGRSLNILPVVEDGIFLGFILLHTLIKEGFLSTL